MLLLLVLLPVGAGLLTWAFGGRRPALVAPWALGALGVTLAGAVVGAAEQPAASLRWGAGLTLRLEVVDLARAPLVLVPFVGLAVVTYALSYGEPEGRPRLVGLLIAFVGVMEMLLVSADLLSLLVAWELVGLVSWGLIAHHWRGDAPDRAREAFLATRAGDLGLFVAAGALFGAAGSLDLAAIGDIDGPSLAVVAGGVLLAATAKSAQLPFSPWLFSAMAGPTPASALLHSATMVAAGAYLLARLHPVLDEVAWFGPVTIAIGLVTALGGGIVAAVHPQAKKLLAASTSAHHGLMFVAVGAGYPVVAVAHLVAHGVTKALLFIAAGVAIDRSGSEDLADLRTGPHLPVVAGLALVGTLGLAGVPPLGAAWTKEAVVSSATHTSVPLGVLVVVAGALSAFYAARFQLAAPGRGRGDGHAGSAPVRALVALAGLGAAGVGLGVLWTPRGEEQLRSLTGGELPASAPWELVASVALLIVAAYAALLLDRSGRLPAPASGRVERVADWFGLAVLARVAVITPTTWGARRLAAADDRVVDGGVRGAATLAAWTSGHLASADDRVVDAGVRGVAALTARVAALSDRLAEVGIDGAVRSLAALTGAAGRDARRLQSGQLHHYYSGIAGGLAVLTLVAVLWR